MLAVVVALRIARREANRELERQRADEANRSLAAARLLVVDLQWAEDDESLHFKHLHGHEIPPVVEISNFGSAHVLYPRVEGFVHQNDGGLVTWDIENVAPFEYRQAPSILPAGERDKLPVRLNPQPPIVDEPDWTKPIVGFTDAEGQRWRRVGHGEPQRVSPDDSFRPSGPEWYRVDGHP